VPPKGDDAIAVIRSHEYARMMPMSDGLTIGNGRRFAEPLDHLPGLFHNLAL
jgi:hypothetical protein